MVCLEGNKLLLHYSAESAGQRFMYVPSHETNLVMSWTTCIWPVLEKFLCTFLKQRRKESILVY